MSRPLRASLAAQMLAYVDNCLPLEDRRALEDKMAGDPAVKGQVEQWLAQNAALRAAFAPRPRALDASAGRQSGPARLETAPPRQLRRRRTDKEPARGASSSLPRSGGRALARRTLAALAGALALWAASASLLTRDTATPLLAAAAAAYRTYADNATHPVEFATADRAALQGWFAAQIGRPAEIPDLAASGLRLIGGRVVPGAYSPAEFALYENASRERVGVAIEPLDSPPASDVAIRRASGLVSASWTGAGHSFAMVGRAASAPIAKLARLARSESRDN